MYQGIGIVDISLLIRIGAAHKDKILFVLDGAIQHLSAVLQPLPKKALFVIASRGNTYQQLVGVGFHGFLKKVVLLRLGKSVDFIADRNIAVKRILRIRVCSQSADKKRAVWKLCLH